MDYRAGPGEKEAKAEAIKSLLSGHNYCEFAIYF